jgi:hypothetical protein
MLPLGIVIPTRNSKLYLPRHVEALACWAELAEQIVVVDSHSNDGTVEFLKSHLPHPNIAFVSHPPGLYSSWNFGIQQLQTRFTYIATVGDTITRAGITELVGIAETLQADVIISKPTFVHENGAAAAHIAWPVDNLIATHRIDRPRLVHPLEILLSAATGLDGTLLGSCASNLFRTRTLQQFPFPVEFGKAGDGAWAAMHFANVKWAVTPAQCSTFLIHPDLASTSEVQAWQTSPRLDQVLRTAVEKVSAADPVFSAALAKLKVFELLESASRWLDDKDRFDRTRRQRWPWILNPRAWQARQARNRARRECFQKRDEIVSKLPGAA